MIPYKIDNLKLRQLSFILKIAKTDLLDSLIERETTLYNLLLHTHTHTHT
jgi:hypothetical protein